MEELYNEMIEEGMFGDLYSDDDLEDDQEYGHPDHSPDEVLENLAAGFKYHKDGPARSYHWTKDDVKKMTDMIRRKNLQVRARQARERIIRGQNYLGISDKDHLLRWVNSCRLGYRFSLNSKVERGPKLRRNEWSNKRLWHYVSRTLLAEFDFWTEIFNSDQAKAADIKYPKVSDLIFRHNEDFTSGLWSEFSQHWEKFIDKMR